MHDNFLARLVTLGVERIWTLKMLRATAAACGILLIFCTWTVYEDEEGRLQSKIKEFQERIQGWWVRVDDGRKASMPWVARFIKETSGLLGRCFDLLFTKRLFSMRVIGVSFMLSVASFFLSVLAFPSMVHSAPVPNPKDAVFNLFRFTLLALVPAFSESPSMPFRPWLPRMLRFWWWIWIIRWMAGVLDFLIFMRRSNGPGAHLAPILAELFALVLVISAVCDVSYIALTRWSLRRISTTNTTSGILIWISLLVLLLFVVLIVPPLVGLYIFSHSKVLGVALVLSVFANSVDAVVILATILVALMLLAHRLIWPLIQRPLYAIQRMEFASPEEWNNRKGWLRGIGFTLVVLSIPSLPEWLKALFEKL